MVRVPFFLVKLHITQLVTWCPFSISFSSDDQWCETLLGSLRCSNCNVLQHFWVATQLIDWRMRLRTHYQVEDIPVTSREQVFRAEFLHLCWIQVPFPGAVWSSWRRLFSSAQSHASRIGGIDPKWPIGATPTLLGIRGKVFPCLAIAQHQLVSCTGWRSGMLACEILQCEIGLYWKDSTEKASSCSL